MSISSVGSNYVNYANYYSNNTIKDDNQRESNISAKNNTKTTYKSVADYTSYLQDNYSYFGKQSSVYGVPTTVTVSSDFLQKCVDDPEKAEWLERNLKAFAESTKWANNYLKSMPGSPVRVYQSMTIDENGNMSMCSRSTNDPDGKIARENAAKKAQENKEKQEALERKRIKQKEEKEELLEKIAQNRKARKEMLDARLEKEDTEAGNNSDVSSRTTRVISGYKPTVDIKEGSNYNSYI